MKRQKTYSMNKKAANETLQNIFEACDTRPNTVSFDTLILRTKANTTLVSACKWISIVALVLVILCPLAFHSQKGNLDIVGNESSRVMVVSHNLYKDHFEMVLQGNNIDYAKIYGKRYDGTVVIPTVSDAQNHIVEIPFDGTTLNIYITCTDGTTVQALLSK